MVGLRTNKPFHVIVGSTDKISAIFANKEARIAGLTEKVRKARADDTEAGAASSRDLAKPIVSNVTAQAVQANMASPRAQVTPEDDAHALSDPKPVSTPTAKMYSYNSGSMPSSNATHGGKARANFAVFSRTAPDPRLTCHPVVTPLKLHCLTSSVSTLWRPGGVRCRHPTPARPRTPAGRAVLAGCESGPGA